MLEHVVAIQLQGVLGNVEYLDLFQSSLRLGFGMETALVILVDDLSRDLDRGSVSLLILFDHSERFFDTINLLEHLSRLGEREAVLCWVLSFLSDRSQKVMLFHPMTFGVWCPWGRYCFQLGYNI